MSDDRYARVYYDRIAKDPKFDGIRHDRAVMGSWLFLLIEAEKAWPAPAFQLPKTWVPRRDFLQFVERGIIDLERDGRYFVHGLDGVRKERSQRASDAANDRWGNARGNASGIPDSNASHARASGSVSVSVSDSESEPSRARDRADLEAFRTVKQRDPTERQRAFMDRYLRAFDVTGPDRAARLILRAPHDPIGALKDDLDGFLQERRQDALAQELPSPGPTRSVENTILLNHRNGWHSQPDSRCPACKEAA